jgi:uncharacterized membrane protein
MYIRWIVAALHLLALGIGLGAIWWRARSLRATLDPEGLKRVLYADTLWGIAALLWIITGLARAFAGLEKGSGYYLSSSAFWIKMALLGIILLLEIRPMSTFIGCALEAPGSRPSISIPTVPRASPIPASSRLCSSSSWFRSHGDGAGWA